MVDEVKDAPQSASPEANRLLADALKMPRVSNYKTVVKDLKAPELPKREAIVPEKSEVLPLGTDYMARMKPGLEKLQDAEQKELERQADLKLEEARMEGDKYTKLSDSAAQQKRDILADPARADYRRALEDKAKPFIPHEENSQDLMMLFGLLNVVGFAIGSGGKEYSQAAMSAMNGMLEGHKKGRDDLYKKEKSIFETNQKQLDSRIKQLLAFMQDTELLSGMDKTARDQAIEGEFLRNKADTLKEFYKKRGYGATVEYLKSVNQAMDKTITLDQQEKQRAAKEDFDIRKMKAQSEENRQQDSDNFTRQISLKQQELQQKALEAHEARDFELQRDVQNRSFTLQAKLADFAHGEYLAKLNRDSADTRAALDRAERANDREAERKLREKQQGIEQQRLDETIRHDKKREEIERARLNAEKQPTTLYTDPKTGIAYQYDANKRSWIQAPGLPTGVEKVGGGRGGSAQNTAIGVLQQDVENARYNLKDLKDLASPTGKLPGGSVAFAQKFTGDMTSMLMRYAANSSIDEGLQGMDALMLNLAFDIASAQSGGRGQLSDTKVRAVVSQMPLDEQPEATKATKWAALLERVDNANKTLPEGKKVEIPADVRSYYSRGRTGGGGGGAPKEGDKSTSKSGKPIVYRNGEWHYE